MTASTSLSLHNPGHHDQQSRGRSAVRLGDTPFFTVLVGQLPRPSSRMRRTHASRWAAIEKPSSVRSFSACSFVETVGQLARRIGRLLCRSVHQTSTVHPEQGPRRRISRARATSARANGRRASTEGAEPPVRCPSSRMAGDRVGRVPRMSGDEAGRATTSPRGGQG